MNSGAFQASSGVEVAMEMVFKIRAVDKNRNNTRATASRIKQDLPLLEKRDWTVMVLGLIALGKASPRGPKKNAPLRRARHFC